VGTVWLGERERTIWLEGIERSVGLGGNFLKYR
jgi:hypothetical protein